MQAERMGEGFSPHALALTQLKICAAAKGAWPVPADCQSPGKRHPHPRRPLVSALSV